MMQIRQCYIFGAGSFSGLRTSPNPSDYMIAADGGYEYCLQEGLTPHLLLGDFDSLTVIPTDISILRYPSEKDDTDTMLAIKEGLSRGYRRFQLYGCGGGRLDHTLGNLQALSFLAKEGAQGFLYTETEVFSAIFNDTLLLPAREDGLFSVFCLGHDLSVTIRGAKYPLEKKHLRADLPLGVSNRFQSKPVEIVAEGGCLLICWPLVGPQPY